MPSSGLAWIKDHPNETVEGRLNEDLRSRREKIWLANSPTDSLTPIVQRFIGLDVPLAFVPITNRWDRGRVLEEEWQALQLTFCDLEAGEREGWRPSLIVSPYLVDRAQPMFISNLKLTNVINPEFAMQFFEAFPNARDTFKLATAIRMNATFPFISPAVRLPMPGRPRVVDAGYFDNFGITAAAMFLRNKDVRDFIKTNQLDVIFVRILAYGPEAEGSGGGLLSRIQQVTEAVTSPLEGALAARETRGRFANDLLLESLEQIYEGRFHVFKFVNPTRASFSWHIQTNDLKEMGQAMSKENNPEELNRLVKAWAN